LVTIEIPKGGKQSLTRNLYFVFDSSGSMNSKVSGKRKIDGAKEAVASFMRAVPQEDNLGLYVYDGSGGREVLPLGPGNHKSFLEEIQKLRPDGGTPLAKAVHFGTDHLVEQYKKQLGYGEFRLIIVTDGEADVMDDFLESLRYATSYRIPIYAIGIDVELDNCLRDYAVYYAEAHDYQQLQKALQDTLAEVTVFDPTEFQGQ
ncbi:MAG: VWA domain-containing protein, partial [Candidatus Atribacteria bacterium]